MRKASLVILSVTIVVILVSCSNPACAAAAPVPIPDHPPIKPPLPKPSTPHVEPPPKPQGASGAGEAWKETAVDRGKDAVDIAQGQAQNQAQSNLMPKDSADQKEERKSKQDPPKQEKENNNTSKPRC